MRSGSVKGSATPDYRVISLHARPSTIQLRWECLSEQREWQEGLARETTV